MVRKLLVLIFMVELVSCTDPGQGSAEGNLTLYSTAQAAQKHCPKDTVAWSNLSTGVFHFQGQR
jgi:hypothetical protein